MVGSPIHEPSGSLIGSKEEDLLLSIQIDDGSLDTRRLSRKKKVGDGVDVSLKAEARVGSEGGEDRSLRSSANENENERTRGQLSFPARKSLSTTTHPSGISLFLRA